VTPRDRIRRYSRFVAGAAVLLFALICFLVILSPRMRNLDDLNQRLSGSTKELSAMRKEIEDARIAGGPTVGGARFDKFGILSTDEEQIFLSDLIAFCNETDNALNLVRRSEFARPVASAAQGGQQGSSAAGQTTQPQPASSGPPPPVILRVPHTVSFSGTFLSAFYLLRKLESYRRLLTVERMDLITDSQRGYPRLSGNVTIELYLVKQPAGAEPAGPPPAG